ncbi:uncharacterized protein PFL1_04660 [Pseudozyma flocculosa PF-1]|uniref:Uncharacterized protein n=1 Tax=Pseudozyma flocculosa PF-1 TaxID=1277687 RepID=A0A061HBF6_9BASI|nr:uncharacterized protein PFL1_04660 [Pseudozyma flocculosa PF-1]EPQ27916.1 hypothetical protein PFL1_04660 [Pseudozyma flocculosa PF-1]
MIERAGCDLKTTAIQPQKIKTLLNGGPDGNTCLLGSSIPPQAPVPFNGVVCTFNTREKKYDCPVGNEAFNIACEKAGGSFEVGSGH